MPQGSFGTRLLIAAKAAIGLFSEPSASQAFHLLSGVYPGASGAAPERGTREILEGYSSMPWLRAVAQKISHSVASTQWQLYAPPRGGRRARIIQRAYGRERRDLILRATAEEKLKPIESHLLLDALASANAFMVGPSLLRISSVHVDLVGETFWIKERNGLGAPIAFWPLPPNWIAETPTPKRRSFRVAYGGWQEEIPDTEILWIVDPDPANPYSRGSGLARTLADELETDEFAARHCHDDQTECLTRRGWVNGLDLLDTDEVATWNPTIECIEYHHPLHITRARHVGEMHHWHGQRVDACVTPTHRLWVERKDCNKPGYRPWELVESQQVSATPGRAFRWRDTGWYGGARTMVDMPAVARVTKRKPGSRGGGRAPKFGVDEPLTYEVHAFAAFLGYYVSEGSRNRRAIGVGQSEGKYVADIRRALSIFPPEWVRERYVPVREKAHWKPAYQWTVTHHGLCEWMGIHVGDGAANKRLPVEVYEWPVTAQRELLRTLINGDGSRTKDGEPSAYYSHSKGLIDDVQRLCVQVGWSTYVSSAHGEYFLHIRTDSVSRLLHAHALTRGTRSDSTGAIKKVGVSWVDVVDYDGVVWCVTVPNELFFSRRNGHVMLSGNTRMTFINRARPDLIIWPEETRDAAGVISDAAVQRLAERWRAQHGGFWRAALPYFASRKIGIHELSQSFKELDLVPLRQHERDTIRQTFGMPPEMMGIIAPGSARATIDTGEYIFEKHLIEPRREFFRAHIQERIVPEYDDRLVLSFASTIEEDKVAHLEAAKAAPWAPLVDDWRKMQGLEPLPDGRGQVHVLPSTSVAVADLASAPMPQLLSMPAGREPVRREVEAIVGRTVPALPPSPFSTAMTRTTSDVTVEWASVLAVCREAGDEEGETWAARALLDDIEDLPELSRRVARREPAVRRSVASRLQQLSEGTPLDEVTTVFATTIDPDVVLEHVVALVPFQAWQADAIDDAATWLAEVWLVGAKLGAEAIGLPTKAPHPIFNVANPEAVAWAAAHAAELIRAQINPASIEGVRAAVIQGLQEGWSATKLARVVRGSIGLTARQSSAVLAYAHRLQAADVPLSDPAFFARVGRYTEAQRRLRAAMIARTELAGAASQGQQRLWDLAAERNLLDKTKLRKKWVPAYGLPDICQFCEALGEADPVAIDGAFPDGWRQPTRHPGCRCATSLVRAE